MPCQDEYFHLTYSKAFEICIHTTHSIRSRMSLGVSIQGKVDRRSICIIFLACCITEISVRFEALLKLANHIAIHGSNIVFLKERTKRAPSDERVHFGPIYIPRYLRTESRNKIIPDLCALRYAPLRF